MANLSTRGITDACPEGKTAVSLLQDCLPGLLGKACAFLSPGLGQGDLACFSSAHSLLSFSTLSSSSLTACLHAGSSASQTYLGRRNLLIGLQQIACGQVFGGHFLDKWLMWEGLAYSLLWSWEGKKGS